MPVNMVSWNYWFHFYLQKIYVNTLIIDLQENTNITEIQTTLYRRDPEQCTKIYLNLFASFFNYSWFVSVNGS